MRQKPKGGSRARALLVVAMALGAGVALTYPPSVPAAAQRPSRALPAVVDDIRLREPGYTIQIDPDTAVATVASPRDAVYTSFPLTMLAGETRLPPGSHIQVALTNGTVVVRVTGLGGQLVQECVLVPAAHSFTVQFDSLIGPAHDQQPQFFNDGTRAIDMHAVRNGYTPDPAATVALTSTPSIDIARRAPFAPPPFYLGLQTAPGWMGIGLVQVPDATAMQLTAGGSVAINYPLSMLGPTPDLGDGAAAGDLVRFPAFGVTFASGPAAGLRAYHDSLSQLGAATEASPPGSRPSWWSQPLVDTWGEQMATGAERGSAQFTAAWVRDFVATWRQRFGVSHFTVIIDSRWQQSVGLPEPDLTRFGGYDGMRTLIDQLHAEGLHVVLWWPLWAQNIPIIPLPTGAAWRAEPANIIDPTTTTFNAYMATTVQTLLGNGPGQLGADGLKLDWGYNIPQRLARPGAAWGAAALYRYMRALYSDAHDTRPDAFVDASAVAPQFESVADAIRLYDSWSDQLWAQRAVEVTAVDPGALIDGDGWQASQSTVVSHLVTSAVYGTPAFYFSTTWADHAPISSAFAQEMGVILNLAADKGQGVAHELGNGTWTYTSKGAVRAQTFDGNAGLVVWTSGSGSGCGVTRRGTVVSTEAGLVVVPAVGRHVTVTGPGGKALPVEPVAGGSLLDLAAWQPYSVRVTSARTGCA